MFPLRPPFGLFPDPQFSAAFPFWNTLIFSRAAANGFPQIAPHPPGASRENLTRELIGTATVGSSCKEQSLLFHSTNTNELDEIPLEPQPGLLRLQLTLGGKKFQTVICTVEDGLEPESSLELSPIWRSFCRVDAKLANCDGQRVLTTIGCGQEIVLTSRDPPTTSSPLNLSEQKSKNYREFSILSLSRSDDEIVSESPPDVPNLEDIIVSGGKGFGCPRCGKVFSYEYYRDKHLKYTRCVDQGDRKFPCSSCSRSFEKRDRLRIHVLHVHENHRPHACLVCGKAFSQSSSLNKHLRVHSGERPYKCSFCPKAFTASSILRTHIRQHSGEKPFKCAQCGKPFASHAAHDSHVRRTHGDLKTDD